MAELFPDEGLDYLLGVVPKNGTTPANLYIGLFTNATASTTPVAGAVLASYTNVTENTLAANNYNRITHSAASWGAAASGGGGRQTTGTQKTFTCTGSAWTTVNGFYMADSASHGSEKAIFYANFDDTQAVTLQVNDTLAITPRWVMLG